MIPRIARVASMALLAFAPIAAAFGQDVPGIEICTVEKTMERRTSCLQSNVDFLHKTITKLAADHQQKLDAANRQIEALKASVIAMQKIVDDLRSAQAKPAEDLKKIQLPVLVMHSEDDQIVPYVASGPKSAELLANGTLKTYQGFPHGMPTTEHETINADLLAFLRS